MAEKLYTQVITHIKENILSGKYKVGDQIPTEAMLALTFGVSRPTVRQALSSLAMEGYLLRIKGSGTFVSQPKVLHESTTFIAGYHTESQKKGRTIRTKVLSLSVEHASECTAKALGLSVGSKVTKLVRLRSIDNYNDNKPVLYTTVYVPFKLFPEMSELDFSDTSFYDVIDGKGLSIRHATRDLEVVTTPADIAGDLQISPFEPSIFVTSIGKTVDMHIVEYAESYYPAGCSRFLVEINR